MSASKFAGLEGVDFDSPDVYETHSPSPKRKTKGLTDERNYGSSDDDSASGEDGNRQFDSNRRNRKVGQSDKNKSESNVKNGDIVKSHLNVQEATSVFRDATGVDGKGVDFSSSIHRRKKKADYYPRPAATFETTTYVLGTGTGYRTADQVGGGEADPWKKAGEKESALDRFRRLRFELDELEKEVQVNQKEDGKVTSNADQVEKAEVPENLLPQLQTLRNQLASLHQSDTFQSFTQPNRSVQWQTEAKKLLQSLDQNTQKAESDSKGLQKGFKSSKDEPDSGSGTEMTRLADVDQRLAGLESLIGIQDALQSETQTLPRPLLPSLSRIEHLLTLLTQPRHLDGISRRIKVLVSELERVHEARRKLIASNEENPDGARSGEEGGNGSQSINLPPETLKKLDTILPILSKVDSMMPIVPNLLSRLQSLSSLHAKSSSFSHDVEALEEILKTSNTQSQEMKQMLENLQSSMTENETRTKQNLTIVEERIESIVKRMDALR